MTADSASSISYGRAWFI